MIGKTEGRSRFYSLQRLLRACANHRRIEILEFLEKHEGASLSSLAKDLKVNIKTAAAHLQRLAAVGLIYKWADGVEMKHRLSRRGIHILKFSRTIE